MLAQAFKDLARGEQTADAMEKHLNVIEKKIEELLAKAEEEERRLNSRSGSDSKQSLRTSHTNGAGDTA